MYVACNMYIVKKKGIRNVLRIPEWEEPLGRLVSVK